MIPLALLIGGLLSAAGAGANTIRQGQIDQARQHALDAERLRQKRFDQEAQAFNVQSQDRFKGFSGEEANKGQKLGDYLAKASVPVDDPNAVAGALMPTSSSDIVTREVGRANAAASDAIGKQAAALGDFRAFGDLLGEKSLSQARDAGNIAQIGGFKKGSAGVLPYELEAANSKGQALGLLADLLGGSGSVVTSASISGGGLGKMFGGAAAATPAVTGIGSDAVAAPLAARAPNAAAANAWTRFRRSHGMLA
jgi:hypothetical protein